MISEIKELDTQETQYFIATNVKSHNQKKIMYLLSRNEPFYSYKKGRECRTDSTLNLLFELEESIAIRNSRDYGNPLMSLFMFLLSLVMLCIFLHIENSNQEFFFNIKPLMIFIFSFFCLIMLTLSYSSYKREFYTKKTEQDSLKAIYKKIKRNSQLFLKNYEDKKACFVIKLSNDSINISDKEKKLDLKNDFENYNVDLLKAKDIRILDLNEINDYIKSGIIPLKEKEKLEYLINNNINNENIYIGYQEDNKIIFNSAHAYLLMNESKEIFRKTKKNFIKAFLFGFLLLLAFSILVGFNTLTLCLFLISALVYIFIDYFNYYLGYESFIVEPIIYHYKYTKKHSDNENFFLTVDSYIKFTYRKKDY